MQKSDQLTRCYVITERLDNLLKLWAEQNDRTASAELRQILEREAQRRQPQPESKPVTIH
ncbi:MAG: hypothetical protein HC875_40375 [Anaerolineales bacterium]|nr:hypothetical protein [Anaerolineales bacterium]